MSVGSKPREFPAHWFILFVGILISVSAAVYVTNTEERAGQLKYDADVGQVMSQIKGRFERYENLLNQTRAFFDSHPDLTKEQFKTYTDGIELQERYPGIQGLGYTVRVSKPDLNRHIKKIRSSGQTGYHIWPEGDRNDYFSILYLEPMDWRNERAIGYDMFTEPIRHEAMAQARDTGKAALSGKVTLVQEVGSDPQPGFLLYAPLYKYGTFPQTVEERRRDLIGFIYSPFRSYDLFSAIFSGQKLSVDFEMFAGANQDENAKVYDHKKMARVAEKPRFSSVALIELGGRTYSVRFSSLSSFQNDFGQYLPYLVGISGLVITMLLWWLIIFQKQKAAEAERARLRVQSSEQKFQALFRSAPFAAGLIHFSNAILADVNPEFEEMTEYQASEIIGKRLDDNCVIFETGFLSTIQKDLSTNDKIHEREIKINTKSGQKLIATLSARFIEIEEQPFVLFSLIDITSQKKAQEDLAAERIKLEQIFTHSPAAMALWVGEDLIFEKVNPGYRNLFNDMELVGKPLVEAIPEFKDQPFPNLIRQVLHTGESYSGKEILAKHRRTPDGPLEDRYYDFSYVQIKNPDGTPYGVYDHAIDVTDKVLARRDLEAKTAQLETIIEQMPLAVVFADASGKLMFANKQLKKVWRHEFIPANTVDEYREYIGFHPDGTRYEGKDWPLARALMTGKTIINEDTDVLLGDGTRGILRISAAPVKRPDGTIFGGIVLSHDVTDLKKSEEALIKANAEIKRNEKILKTITDNTASSLFMMDETGRPTFMNPAAEKLTGYTLEEIKDRPLHYAVHNKKPDGSFYPMEECPIDNAQVKLKALQNQEEIFVDKTGRLYPVSYSVAPLERDGVMIGSVLEFRDISEQKEAEKALRKAKEEAERANELKSAFLANMSHEIRTPLGAMVGFADLLRDPALTREERESYIDVLTRNGENLGVIINDILDLSKVEAGHLVLEFTDFSPAKVIEEVVSLLSVKADEKQLNLEYECAPGCPEVVIADPVRLRQILINLVGNAIKFTRTGSIKIRAYGCHSKGNQKAICFEISDTGIGIESSQVENIFEMFVQGDGSMTRRFGGTGLGLALSRKLARAMGGDVSIKETKLGSGTTFLVQIEDHPEKRTSRRVEEPHKFKRYEPLDQVLKGCRILIVDDAPDNQQLIKRYLLRQGATIEVADNGYLGYREALSNNYDVVLMDIQMPVMDGFTATQKLREDGYRKPIIALTAHAMSEIRRKAFNVGFTDHLTKPINPDGLVSAVVRNLPQRELDSEI